MLSPTLALRCPQCQHALALADIRTSPTCPGCGAPHGLPSAVADSLALYERAIQQTVLDLIAAAPAPADGPTVGGGAAGHPTVGAPADAAPVAPAPLTSPPAAPGPAASILTAPLPPTTLIGRPTAPVPPASPPAPVPPASSHVPEASPPVATMAGPPTLEFTGLAADPAASRAGGSRPSLPPSAISTLRGEAVQDSAPLSLPPTPRDTLEVRTPTTASNSSLLSLLSDRSATALSETPLLVAAVRDPAAGDTQPAAADSPSHRFADAVRQLLPNRQGAEPEAEGRIPATALAVARRALLTRYADERRHQQVRDSSLGLFVAAVLCIFLVVGGLWYLAIPIAVVALVLRLRREERSEKFAAEVQRLADALGGDRLPSYDAIAAWFDGLWPAPVSPEAMWTSHLHGAVRCQIDGYAALLDVHLNEKTAGGVVYPPRITAYLAAVWPGRVPTLRTTATDLPPSAQARMLRLRRAGYTVVADAHGGLILRTSESIAQAARADITRLPALQVPIHELADLARELGGEPVAAP